MAYLLQYKSLLQKTHPSVEKETGQSKVIYPFMHFPFSFVDVKYGYGALDMVSDRFVCIKCVVDIHNK